uniref:Uncharacterized protein n=1 Tax=Schlesneria paludicola TaxID=360056 RepID=A0A7C2NWQ6_9PLAN
MRVRMTLTLQAAISQYGSEAKAKLHNPAVSGEPEDQLRAPFESLLDRLAALCRFPANTVAAVGESSLADLNTRPDYAVTLRHLLVGFVELRLKRGQAYFIG